MGTACGTGSRKPRRLVSGEEPVRAGGGERVTAVRHARRAPTLALAPYEPELVP